MHKKIATFVLASALGAAGSSQAVGVIYNSTGNPRYDALVNPVTPLRYHVNGPPSPNNDPSRILYDDVPVYTGDYVAASVDVTLVEVDIVVKNGAPASLVTAYWSPLTLDVPQTNGGPNDDPSAANIIGALANTAGVVTPLGNGDSIVRLAFPAAFNTGPLNTTQAPGDPRQFFNIGLSFSNVSDLNGWEIADHPDNLDLLWDYLTPTTLSEFSFLNDTAGDPIYGVMALKVTGTLVPEPGTIGLLMGGGMMLLRRRARLA